MMGQELSGKLFVMQTGLLTKGNNVADDCFPEICSPPKKGSVMEKILPSVKQILSLCVDSY